NQIVRVVPSVLGAGGSALDMIGLILTQNYRVPIGIVKDFPSATAVGNYFGATSQEAGLASVYFNGFDGSNVKPGQLLFAQYAESPIGAWLQGGVISGMTLAALQALTGSLNVTIDGVLKTASSINLSAATSL